LITPTAVVLTLLAIGKIMICDFGMIYGIIGDNSMLYPTTNVIDTYVYRALRQLGDIGMSAAAGLYQSVVGFILVLGSNLLARRFSQEGALF
jgi:putative aldouronate transport system permease protein